VASSTINERHLMSRNESSLDRMIGVAVAVVAIIDAIAVSALSVPADKLLRPATIPIGVYRSRSPRM